MSVTVVLKCDARGCYAHTTWLLDEDAYLWVEGKTAAIDGCAHPPDDDTSPAIGWGPGPGDGKVLCPACRAAARGATSGRQGDR